jgi:predicted nucleic acid-binding protein
VIVVDASAVIEVLLNTPAGIQMAERFFDPDETLHAPHLQARIIHEDFYCNHRHAAATSLTAGGLAAQSVNILFQVCFPPSRLRAPVSPGVSAVSSRTLVNSAG